MKPVAAGQWGGTGVLVDVTRTGASVQFDCAKGQISQQLRMRKDGSFSAIGSYERSGPGPIRVDRQQGARKVIYKGKVTGNSMSIKLTDSETKEDLGSFALVKGAGGRIHRCY